MCLKPGGWEVISLGLPHPLLPSTVSAQAPSTLPVPLGLCCSQLSTLFLSAPSQPLTATIPRLQNTLCRLLLLGLGGWGWGMAEPGKEVRIFFSVLFQMCILHTLLQPTLAHLPTTPANHRSPTDLFSD